MQSLDAFASEKLQALDSTDLRRRLATSARHDAAWIERGGRRLLSFSCNDYLNLSQHPSVRAAAAAAIAAYGTGSGGSRLVTGNHPLYAELEARLARLKGTEAACVFGSGYLANTGVIPALVGAGDLILVDELVHACIWAGARLSGAAIRNFRHNDAGAAAAILAERQHYRHALIVTEGVFSMDGDVAPLGALAELARRSDAWLMSDDAHGVGVLGQGRGSGAALGLGAADIPLQMGTLSKALGSYGGYLCASRAVIDLLHSRARTLVYSTGLPPASIAAAIAALDIVAAEPALTERPLAKARRFTALAGLSEAQSPIVPIVIGSASAALAASRLLEEEGFLVTAIRPPTVADGMARLRLAFCAQHPDSEIERLAGIVAARLRR